MDKSTLSNYGWLTIVTLILAVMLAFATPFGTYVGDAVVSVANGFVGSSNQAMDDDNINDMQNKWEEKLKDRRIPTGAKYYTNVNFVTCQHGIDVGYCEICNTDTKLNYSQQLKEFPNKASLNDAYVFGDYLYKYETIEISNSQNPNVDTYTGWQVYVTDRTKATYGKILESINGEPVISLNNTFIWCQNLVDASHIVIPSSIRFMVSAFEGSNIMIPPDLSKATSVENMDYCFLQCYELSYTPIIPENVTTMDCCFIGCSKLSVAPKIPSKVNSVWNAFFECSGLTGTIIVDSMPTYYEQFLSNTQITAVKMSNGTTHPMESQFLATIN